MPKTSKRTKKFNKTKLSQTISERKKYQNRKRKRGGDKPIQREESTRPEKDDTASMTQHIDQLESLKDSQREFFEFLQKNDPNLLDLEGSTEESSEEEKVEDELTMDILDGWKEKAVDGHVKSIKAILGAFRIACHMGDMEEDEFKFKFSIVDSDIFNDVILFCLDSMSDIFDIYLERYQTEEDENTHFVPNRSNKWKSVKRLVKNLVSNSIHFLHQLSEPTMMVYVLNKLELMSHYIGVYPKVVKVLLKKLLSLWEGSSEAVRIAAYLNIRAIAIKMPYPLINDCLKGIYLTFIRNMKHFNAKNVGLINFLSNCVVDLYGLDFVCSYQHAFVYIRELGVHLRAAYSSKTKESHTSIYNWKNYYSLKIWADILVAYPEQESLKLLVFPLIQVLQGVISYVTTPRYYPARIKILKLLVQINKTYPDMFMNTGMFLIDVFNGPLFSARKKKKYTGKPLQIENFLKAPENMLSTISYQDTILGEIHDLILAYLTIYSKSIAFPELILPMMITIKKFVKATKSPFYNKKYKTLMEKINMNAKFILAKRNNVNFSPADTDKVEGFLSNTGESPLEKFAKTGYVIKEKPVNNPQNDETESEEDESSIDAVEQPPKKKRRIDYNQEDDIVEDLVLSSSDESDDAMEYSDSSE